MISDLATGIIILFGIIFAILITIVAVTIASYLIAKWRYNKES